VVAFQFYLEAVKQKNRFGGGHGENGSARRCVVMQEQVLLSPKFRAKSSQIFTQSP
jgi:hypothetical protein